MNKRLQSLFTAMIISTFILASPVSVNVARQVAVNWYKNYAPSNIKDFSVNNVVITKNKGLATYYVFTFTSGGFVMVAADDISYPLLGYSYESGFEKSKLPPNASAFFDDYSNEIWQIVNAGLDNKDTRKEWDKILNNAFEKDLEAVNPLCTTTWSQDSPYNALCPNGDPTGCVATAMAQIMKKWNYPATGTGSFSYTPSTHPEYGAQTANFGSTTYNWGSMPDNATSSNSAIATLMYHCGVSVKMDYDAAGSGALMFDVSPAMVNYFKYQPSAEVKYRDYFPGGSSASDNSNTAWTLMIKAEMDAGRPVLLAGSSTASGGHAFVCDGYNAANKFHINWGWGPGTFGAIGYYYLSALNPIGNNFSSSRQAVIRIQPLNANMPIADFTVDNIVPSIAQPVNFTDHSLNSPTSWLWTFEGGTPSTSADQNPAGITFASNGYKVITLKVTNATGSDLITEEHYVKVGGVPSAWIKQNTGFTAASRGIDQIDILDQNTVWAKAYDGAASSNVREFTRTNNGGATWTPGVISFTNSASYDIASIYPFSYDVAVAAMYPTGANGGMIVKTVDGGLTWSTAGSPDYSTSWLNLVHFFNTNDGVCMGDPASGEFVIYTTSNGGTSWTLVPGANIPNAETNEMGTVDFYQAFGDTIFFGTSTSRVYRSINKGLNWTVSSTGMTANQTELSFKNCMVGIALSRSTASPYYMKKTNDGGLTWTSLNPTGFFVNSPNLAHIPGTASTWVDVAVYPGNGSSYSINDCASFLNIDTGSVQYTCVSFLDINTGWAGSFSTNSIDGGIYKWNPDVMTNIKKADNDCRFHIYPVPANNILNVTMGTVKSDKMTISIHDMTGRCVFSKLEKAVPGDILQFDISGYDPGLYFFSIQNGNKMETKKFTIVK